MCRQRGIDDLVKIENSCLPRQWVKNPPHHSSTVFFSEHAPSLPSASLPAALPFHLANGWPSSQCRPKGSARRPIRQPCASETGKICLAPAARARAKSASGSGTVRMMRREVPPRGCDAHSCVFSVILAHPEFCALHGEADDASAGRRVVTINLSGRKS